MTQGATSPALPHFASSPGVGRAVPAVTPPRAGPFLQLEPRAPRPAGGRVSVRRLCSPHQSEAVSQGLPGAQGCGGGCRGTWRNTASAGARAPGRHLLRRRVGCCAPCCQHWGCWASPAAPAMAAGEEDAARGEVAHRRP